MRKLTILFIICISLSSCAGRQWTKKELTLAAMSMAAAYADYRTTKHNLDMGPGHVEVNPLIEGRPSNAKLAGYFAISELVTILCAHYMDDYRSHILISKTAVNTSLAIHNYKETR